MLLDMMRKAPAHRGATAGQVCSRRGVQLPIAAVLTTSPRCYTAIPLASRRPRVGHGGADTSTLHHGNAAPMEELFQPQHPGRGPQQHQQPSPYRLPNVRLPRLLIFGGDIVSTTALEALHTRMRSVVAAAMRQAGTRPTIRNAGRTSATTQSLFSTEKSADVDDAEIDALVRDHITVVCPALPKDVSPEEAARRYTRQYPVARYCVDHGLHLVPVDDPKSFKRSRLFEEMIASSTELSSSSPSLRAPLSSWSEGQTVKRSSGVLRRRFSSSFSAAKPTPAVPPDTTAHTWQSVGRPLQEFDLAVVVSFRYFLPQRLLRVLPPVINMHPSLLPHYRGASPIFSALRNNESVGGVSIIQMKPEQSAMDSGSILWQCEVPVAPDMDIRLYFPLVTQIGAAGLCDLIFGEDPSLYHTNSASTRARKDCAFIMPPPLKLPLSSSSTPQHCEGLNNGRREKHVIQQESVSKPRAILPWFALRSSTLKPVVDRPAVGAAALHTNGSAVPSAPHHCVWPTLCRAASHITPAAVHRASKTHRALFFQNLESDQQASGSTAVTVSKKKAKKISVACPPPSSDNATSSDLSLTTATTCADVFPISVRSAHCDWPDSFSYSWKFAAVQQYPTFSSYTDDPFHAPLLQKDAAVLHFSSYGATEAFGVWRAFVGGLYFQPSVNATLDKGNTPVRNQLVYRVVRRRLREYAKRLRHKDTASTFAEKDFEAVKGFASAAAAAAAAATVVRMGTSSEGPPLGHIAGCHVELNVFQPEGLQLLCEAENSLRIPCTFTQVINPILVPPNVRAELEAVEQGQHPGVRFYRPPAPAFRCALSTLGTAMASTAFHLGEQLGIFSQQRGSGTTAPRNVATAGSLQHISKKAVLTNSHAASKGDENAAMCIDDEAPADYVPDVIHAAPPLQCCHRSSPRRRQLHIPPGTGYFPQSDEECGAVRCKDGWLVWRAAHMKCSNRAQPASLIRKGMAMKTGVLYAGLFSEYS